jgi:Cu/Ag efflux protein CusF
MRVWQVVVLLNLAVVLGAGAGWLWSARQVGRLERELAAARSAAVADVEREFQGEGTVRAILPDINVVVITHGDIPGYMPTMTMGFRVASPAIYAGVEIGDTVRFVLRGVPPNLALTGLEKAPS